MGTESLLPPRSRRRPRRLAPAACAVFTLCALAIGVAACGEEDPPVGGDPAAPDTPTTSPTAELPGDTDEVPELPVNDDPAAVTCTGPPQGVFDATAIVGDGVEQATDAAEAEGCAVRVVERDGKALAVTEDFRPDRINVAIKDAIVTEVVNLG